MAAPFWSGGNPPISAFLSHGFNIGVQQPAGRDPGGDGGTDRSAKWTAEEVSLPSSLLVAFSRVRSLLSPPSLSPRSLLSLCLSLSLSLSLCLSLSLSSISPLASYRSRSIPSLSRYFPPSPCPFPSAAISLSSRLLAVLSLAFALSVRCGIRVSLPSLCRAPVGGVERAAARQWSAGDSVCPQCRSSAPRVCVCACVRACARTRSTPSSCGRSRTS